MLAALGCTLSISLVVIQGLALFFHFIWPTLISVAFVAGLAGTRILDIRKPWSIVLRAMRTGFLSLLLFVAVSSIMGR